MRLPAVAIAAAFACGIALRLHPAAPSHAESILFLSSCIIATLALILTGIALTKIGQLIPAAIVALFIWAMLGFLGACVAGQTRSALNVGTLVQQGRLSLQTPLRWHGLLRDEPSKLPWGYGLEIELTGVEYEGGLLPVQGGLRASFPSRPNELPLPEL